MKKICVGVAVFVLFITVVVPSAVAGGRHHRPHHGGGWGPAFVAGLVGGGLVGANIAAPPVYAGGYAVPVYWEPAPPSAYYPPVVIATPQGATCEQMAGGLPHHPYLQGQYDLCRGERNAAHGRGFAAGRDGLAVPCAWEISPDFRSACEAGWVRGRRYYDSTAAARWYNRGARGW